MFIAGFYYVERHHDLKPFSPTDKIPELKDAPKEGAFPLPSSFYLTHNYPLPKPNPFS
jgi:mediator of RNA polymerase II transcription subunit 21